MEKNTDDFSCMRVLSVFRLQFRRKDQFDQKKLYLVVPR